MKHPAIPSILFSSLAAIACAVTSNAQILSKAEPLPQDSMESLIPPLDSAKLVVRSVTEILDTLQAMNIPETYPRPVNKMAGPWVFMRYQHIPKFTFSVPPTPIALPGMEVMTNDSTLAILNNPYYEIMDIMDFSEEEETPLDTVAPFAEEILPQEPPKEVDFLAGDPIPTWLKNAMRSYRMQENLMYEMMVEDPSNLEYSYWTLPVPPKLNPDDVSFVGVMRRFGKADVDTGKAILPENELDKIHWLHAIGGAVQFSQAFVSKNWYQGGNNHLSLLFNFNWNVNLNQVYHPKLLFQSTLTYKLGLNSTPQDEVHSYSISEDLLQYNLNTGWKAFQNWFYSLNMLFKTQIFRNYEQNSMKRKASFLSPGDFNLGLGMAYSHQNEKKTFQFTATISPLSYNLKTCISDKIDHGQFNIKPYRKSRSEIGSNGEFNMNWQIAPNINYKSRVFLFTDYDYFLSDWENTFTFTINKFLSTQLYVHLRYDSSSDRDPDWKQFMMREILSFGLSYAWSTK